MKRLCSLKKGVLIPYYPFCLHCFPGLNLQHINTLCIGGYINGGFDTLCGELREGFAIHVNKREGTVLWRLDVEDILCRVGECIQLRVYFIL